MIRCCTVHLLQVSQGIATACVRQWPEEHVCDWHISLLIVARALVHDSTPSPLPLELELIIRQ